MSIAHGRESVDVETPRVSVDNPTPTDGPADARPFDGPRPTGADTGTRERVDGVLQSDRGIEILLARLKQSIGAARDFSFFLRKRSSLEEEHAQGLGKLVQASQDAIRKPENRQGTFAYNYWEITQIHDRMSKHGLAFAIDLHNMSDDLQDLASNMERGRKHWKQSGLSAETRVRESVGAMSKARDKSYSLADQYDRMRTGERQSGRFGIKKSGAQAEEDLLRKAEGADADYAQKVHSAQSQRTELLNMLRPQAVKALTDLVTECDSGLHLQMQKYAALSERLLLSNGLTVNPLPSETNGAGVKARSLREVTQGVNNEKDLRDYVLNSPHPVDAKSPEIKYEKHHALTSPKQPQQPFGNSQQNFNASQPQFGYPDRANTGLGVGMGPGGPGGPGQRPAHDGQVTGITSYPNRDGQQMYGQQPQYAQQPGGPPNQGQQYNNAPSLPPLNLMSGGAGGLGEGYRQDSNQRPNGGGPMNTNRQDSNIRPDGMPAMNVNRQDTSQRHDGAPFMGPHDQRTVSSPLGMNKPPTQSFDGANNDPRFGQPGMNQNRSASGPGPGYGGPNSENRSGSGPGLGAVAGAGALAGAGAAALAGPGRGGPNNYPSSGPTKEMNVPTYGDNIRSNGGPPQNMPYRTNTQDVSQVPPQGLSQGPSAGFAPDNRGPAQRDAFPPRGGTNGSFGPSAGHAANNSVASSLNKPLTASNQPRQRADMKPNLPPNNPVFGVSLEDLFHRDGSAVPTIVYQCVQAVDLFGLNTEGVYRTSGSAPHIMEMKAMFDHDSSLVDFRTPASFHNDIASVTTLLKHFLRDLPDPLLTAANYSAFIQAAKLEDDIVRRDSLHAIINSMPDPNYATLRVLSLHLMRVASHSDRNRMTQSNLAICFGPTLMGGGGKEGGQGGDIRDAGWQSRVVETILANTLQIFDDDE